MRQSSGNGRWMLKGLGGLCGVFLIAVACAGGDTPPRDAELLQELLDRYDNAVGQAGNTSMAGSGGGGGQGGSVSTNAGSGGAPPAGGSGGSGVAGSGGADVCNAPVDVLKPACGIGSGCHGADARLGDFGDSEAAARALVDVETVNGCGFYIDSANPEQSQILLKLGADIPGNCGAQMPFLNDPLPQSEIDCVQDWLSQF